MSILALTVMIILQLIMMIIFFQVKNSTTSRNKHKSKRYF